eukprot:s2794_g5.t1
MCLCIPLTPRIGSTCSTWNGNPIQSAKIYRCFILGCLPQLKSLDHTSITEEEASGAAGWYRGHLHRQKIRKDAG